MSHIDKEYICSRNCVSFLLLFLLILLAYSNTFTAEWHLDDYANITQNPFIHVDNLQLKSLYQTFHFKTTKDISRPLARLTFGLNWYIGKDSVVGYAAVAITK